MSKENQILGSIAPFVCGFDSIIVADVNEDMWDVRDCWLGRWYCSLDPGGGGG